MTADSAELNGLLAHCAASPDDAPRLVLADWLEVIALPHLARLDLSLSAFETGALAALAKAPALRALEVSIPEDQNPPVELAQLEQLRYLWFRHWGLAKPKLKLHSLRKALPACQIVQRSPATDEDDYYRG